VRLQRITSPDKSTQKAYCISVTELAGRPSQPLWFLWSWA
jgi:hypothetical protein